MQGNFKKAKFYVLEDAENLALFEKMANNYYGLDKEGRQQIRLASIQINEIIKEDVLILDETLVRNKLMDHNLDLNYINKQILNLI
jgi:hypothetical protein